MAQRVSCCIIGKNEIEDIGECLQSVIDKCYEVIYVDTGSTDGTKEYVLKEFPKVKVYDYKWNDDFAQARNFSISKAKGDFVMYIDCDESLVLTTPDGKFPELDSKALHNFSIHNLTDDGNFVNSVCSRLAPNVKGLCFNGKVHEIFASPNKPLNIIPFRGGHIVHKGYKTSYREKKNKNERNVELLLKKYEEQGPSAQVCFYLSQELFIKGEHIKARDFAEEGLKLVDLTNPLDMTFKPLLEHGLITSYCALHDDDNVQKFIDTILDQCHNPECYQQLMLYYLGKKDEDKALKYAFQTLKFINAGQLPPKFVEANIRYTPFIVMAQYYVNEKKDGLMGLYFLELAYGSGLNDPKLLFDIYNLLPKTERNLGKWEFYNQKIYEATGNTNILKDLINCYLTNSDGDKNLAAIDLANKLLTPEEKEVMKIKLTENKKEELAQMVK